MNGTERTALNCDCLLSQGPQGPQGEQGSQGPQGVPGESGPKGDTGNDGKSAYQLAVEGGYTGTEEEFNQQLAGLSELAGDFLPKVFDGNQVISPKTAGTYNSIVFDSKDDRCKFEIRKTLVGFALYVHKKVNGLWQSVAEISSDVENFHSLKCSYSENGKICRIDVTEDGFKVDHYKDGEHADFDINCHTGATFNGKRILTEDDGGSVPVITFYKVNSGNEITIADTSSSSLVKVYKNGVLLEPEEDYSIDGTTLTLTTELILTDKITTEVF